MPRRRLLAALVVAAGSLAAFGASASAQASVLYPQPGVMQITDMPSSLHAGENVVLREVSPLAVFDGAVDLQLAGGSSDWQTVASAPLRPWVFWIHWTVPSNAGGSSLVLRFVLEARGRRLAASPSYTVAVVADAKRRRGR